MSHSLLTKMKTVIYMPEALRSVYHQSEFYYNIINIIRDYMYYKIFSLLYCIKNFEWVSLPEVISFLLCM